MGVMRRSFNSSDALRPSLAGGCYATKAVVKRCICVKKPYKSMKKGKNFALHEIVSRNLMSQNIPVILFICYSK